MRLRDLARQPGWWTVGVFLLCAIIYLPTTDGTQIHDDAYSASLESWRIAVTHRPWLDGFDFNAMARVINPAAVQAFVHANPASHLVAFRSPGVVLASIPAYWLHGGGTSPADYSTAPGNVTAALLTAAAMALLFAAVRRRIGVRVALATVLILAFATPMWSVSANWIFTHAITVFGIAGMAWAADRDRWWLVGLFGGIGLLGRLHVAITVAVVGIGVAIWRRDWRVAYRTGIPSAALLGLGSLWSRWLYGSWVPSGGYGAGPAHRLVSGTVGDGPAIGHGVASRLTNQLGLWVAPDRGLLIWTPAILLLLPALVRSWRKLPDWSRVLLCGGVAYALVQGQIDGFTGGDGFWGYRLMLEPLTCAVPALAFSAKAMGTGARRVLPWLAGVMLAAIAVGAIDPLNLTPSGLATGPWLSRQAAWHNNAFVNLLVHADPGAWVLLFASLAIGYYAPKVWRIGQRKGAVTPVRSTGLAINEPSNLAVSE